MENILNFIPEQLLIIIISTYVMGMFLKSVEYIKDNYIPILLMIFSVIFSMTIEGFTSESILHGILCWGVAVGINQTSKQLIMKE